MSQSDDYWYQMETRGCNWIIPGRILQGAYPFGYATNLATHYEINVFVNLLDYDKADYLPCLQELYGSNAEQMIIYFPIDDYGVPKKDKMDTLLTKLVQLYEEGYNIYIHCYAGKGRATVVSACLLAKIQNISGKQALEKVRESFKRRRGDAKIPESAVQTRFINAYQSSH